MLFNSLHFAAFFPIVVVLYFATPHRARWGLLLAASYYFYGSWNVKYLRLLWLSTVVDYAAALLMGRHKTREARRPYLIGSLVINLGLLAFFKYFNFVSESVQDGLAHLNVFVDTPYLDVLLPVGISFYTFQTLAYTIDVYRGKRAPERHLGYFALYVSYFPQLVAGPIERADRLIPQLRAQRRFNYDDAAIGLCRIAYGYFKKLVVADRLALFVNPVFANPDQATTWTATIAGVFFAFQMYCDFSGYSDIAIGTARMMGIRLSENFRRPFLAPSMGAFWQRWHITLTTWLRDYIYGSIRGDRRATSLRRIMGVLVVFAAFGIWHGANWTFIVCGLIAGVFVILDQITAEPRSRLWRRAGELLARPRMAEYEAASIVPAPRAEAIATALDHVRYWSGVVVTFAQVVFLFVLFRAATIDDAMTMYRAIFSFDFIVPPMEFAASLLAIASGQSYFQLVVNLAMGLLGIVLLLVSYRLPPDLNVRHKTAYLVAISLVILLLGTDAANEFIYFQF
ncbi:MAG TPA: MBOAT family O-acyltransferase [Rhodothermales bacterium]